MSRLINRKPASRVDCLHSLMKLLNNEFGTKTAFSMNEAKFDKTKVNIFNFCPLLISDLNLGFSYCPYKTNPLDKSACGLTNSVVTDSTKQKEVSNTLNALEGLGFLNKLERKFVVTKDGKKFAEASIDSSELTEIFRSGCLRYGPFVGMLAQLASNSGLKISSEDIFVGYPKTVENTIWNGTHIRLSVDSAKDSDVRTKSCLIQWAVASGFLFESSRGESVRPQIDYRDILNAEKRSIRTWSINKARVNQFFSKINRTERPLDYDNLTKNVASLRENGQSVQREITMKLDTIVKNRRLAICWALNHAAMNSDSLDVSGLAALLATQPELFVINEDNFSSVVIEECVVGFAAGIPYLNEDGNRIRPICSVNLEILCANAPEEVIRFLTEQI
jgi:hypothetical protein